MVIIALVLMLIKIDMLLIIFKLDSLSAHPASCALFRKISQAIIMRVIRVLFVFPKSEC